MKRSKGLLLALLLCFATTGAALAQTASALYFVHGAPGRDVAKSLFPALPVDVLVNNALCVVKNAAVGSVSGPYVTAPGAYNVKVSPANIQQPCSNASVFEATVTLKAATATFVVAALGPRRVLTGYVFNADLSTPVTNGKTRLIAAHAANAPPVSVGIIGGARTPVFAPGKSEQVTLAAGAYRFNVYVGNTNTVALGPISAELHSRSILVLFAYGSAYSGTLNYVAAEIPGVY